MSEELVRESQKATVINKETIPNIIPRLLKTSLAFGIIKDTQTGDFHLCICKDEDIQTFSNIEELAKNGVHSGFVAFPFDNRKKKGFFITNSVDFADIELFSGLGEQTYQNEILQSTTSNHYKSGVAEAVKCIKEGHFQKLVFSRKLEIPFSIELVEGVVSDLINLYPAAHLCFFNIPGEGFGVSVSPEVLVEKKETESFIETMALAGTMPYSGQELKGQGWTEKEIEEQALVSRFMKEKFAASGHLQFEEKGPITIQAGNLLHLRTDYKVKTIFKNSFIFLAQSLHPTSAVCGSPRNEAFDWIADHEDFERGFFTGFAGMVGPDFGKLIVLLRTARLENGKATLFSGAGITACSDQNAEWMETEEKMKTLLRVIQ